MVGPGRVELPTSRLSGVRSNHLSYEPLRVQNRTGNEKKHVSRVHRDKSQCQMSVFAQEFRLRCLLGYGHYVLRNRARHRPFL